MALNHEDYLIQILNSKKIELENLNVEHRIEIAKYDTKKQMLQDQIRSIETQLNDSSKNLEIGY